MVQGLGLTLFLSAFLLFCVEPIVGKTLLPVFGGVPSVWNTCLVFFQAMLLYILALPRLAAITRQI